MRLACPGHTVCVCVCMHGAVAPPRSACMALPVHPLTVVWVGDGHVGGQQLEAYVGDGVR